MKTNELTGGIIEKIREIDLSDIIEYVMRFVVAFVLARARVFNNFAPFGVAFAGACMPSAGSVITMLGTACGYMTGGINWALKYLAALVLTRAAVRLLCDTDFGAKRFFAPVVSTSAMACTGFVYALDGGIRAFDLAVFAAETIITGGCTYFYGEVLAPWEKMPWRQKSKMGRQASSVILLVTVLLSFANIYIFDDISAGRALAVILVMLSAFRGGVGGGCAAGVILGLTMDLVAGSAPFFTMAYSMSALISGVFPKSGRLVFSLTFIMSNALAVVWVWGVPVGIPALYETFIAAVVFLLMPDAVLAKASAVFPAEINGYGFLKARDYTRERTERAAAAFGELYETVKTAAGENGKINPENIASVYDRAAEVACRSCKRTAVCWQKDYSDTVDIMNHLSAKLLNNKEVEQTDFPYQFIEKCENFEKLINAINAEARVFRCRRQYRRRLKDSRGAAYNQYGKVAKMLKDIADELGGEVIVETMLEKRLIKFLRGMDIEASVAVFRVRGGKLRVEMRGSGLYILRRDRNYLNKISALLNTSLCTNERKNTPEYMVFTEAEPYRAEVGASALKKKGQHVNGDKGVYFRTDEGVMYVILSDGMGSGEDAANVSASLINILQNFLLSGMESEVALGILRDLMFLKSEENVTSATIDLMRTDLFTGETKIYKYGAAPSYLKKEAAIKRINCTTFPAGLFPGRENEQPYAKAKLSPGTFAVLASDGITAGDDDKWLRELISNYKGNDPQELSTMIVEAASEKNETEDDMTVLVMKFDERK